MYLTVYSADERPVIDVFNDSLQTVLYGIDETGQPGQTEEDPDSHRQTVEGGMCTLILHTYKRTYPRLQRIATPVLSSC